MAKLYWAWQRDAGPGLCSVEIPLAVCERELDLCAARPLGALANLSGGELMSDEVVLEVRPLESATVFPAGFYRLAERRNDDVIQRLVRGF